MGGIHALQPLDFGLDGICHISVLKLQAYRTQIKTPNREISIYFIYSFILKGKNKKANSRGGGDLRLESQRLEN